MPPLGPQRSPPGLAGHDHVLSRAMPPMLALHGPRPSPPRQQWRAGAASAHRRSSFQALSALVTFRSLDSSTTLRVEKALSRVATSTAVLYSHMYSTECENYGNELLLVVVELVLLLR